jgi:phage terminase small subunit
MTSKRKAWLEEYFKCWNASEAARRVGYKWPEKQGPRNKLLMQPEIDARLDEMAMPANEVLARLGDIARADISNFLNDTGGIDWEKVREQGQLIKRVVHQKGSRATIELHDAQSALQHLDKYHGGAGSDPIPTKIEGDVIRIIEHTGEE